MGARAWYELRRGESDERWRWELLVGEGEVLARGQAHESREAAMEDIAWMRENAAGAPVVEMA